MKGVLMSTSRVIFLGFGLAALAAASVHAAATKFDVKPGLWEVTSTGTTTGAPPIPESMLEQMSPEQRARFEAAMKQAMAHANAPRTFKSCVTEKQLEEGPDFADQNDKSCTQTVLKRSARAMEVRVQCTGERAVSGVFSYQASSREAFSGMMDMTVSEGSRSMESKRSVSGKWLGSDCGAVKPGGSEE
jgi:Protein of unknown function (DUF3617)